MVITGDQTVVHVGGAGAGTVEPTVPRLLPRDVPGFTGRDGELARLARLADGGRVVVSAISGTAGVGKTALAVHGAHQLLPLFAGGHLFADLRGYTEGQDPAGPGEVLQVFLRHLGIPAEEVPVTTEERSGLLRQMLASRRVLMVLDNARTEAQVWPLLPGAGDSLVLITSRSVLPGLEADDRISLDVLPEDEAAAMLHRLIGARAEATPQEVAELARLCGRLPLALRIAAQILAAHHAWPVARLARMLTGEQDRLARLGVGNLQVHAAFGVSYAQLDEGDARLFRLLGLQPGPGFSVGSAAALAETAPDDILRVLGRLAEAHLVTEDATGRFGMHDLLRLYARQTCLDTDSQADREAAEARLVRHYADLAQLLDSCVDPRQRPAAEHAAQQAAGTLPSMRDALTMFQAERPSLLAVLGLAIQRGWDEQVRQISKHVGVSLTVLHYLDDLLIVHEAELAIARRVGHRTAEAYALINFGMLYGGLRRFDEAVECFQQALAIFQETDGRDDEGRALVSFGTVYGELRQFDEAVECFQQALAIFRGTGEQYGEGQALANLGIAYRELRRFDEAVDCLQQALAIKRADGDRRGEGGVLNSLGSAYVKLQRFEEAIDCLQKDSEICRETGDRHGEGQALGNLGVAYAELRRFEEAIDCFQKDSEICREVGDRHGEGQALGNLSEAYRQLRRFEEALECCQRSLTIFREVGDRHGEGHALGTLGEVHRQLRQPGRAAACWRVAGVAMRDAGDHEEAWRLEQLAAGTQSRHSRWGLRRRPSS